MSTWRQMRSKSITERTWCDYFLRWLSGGVSGGRNSRSEQVLNHRGDCTHNDENDECTNTA